MSCWLCIPSKRPPEEALPILKLWRERGYKIALLRDECDQGVNWPDHASCPDYLLYPPASDSIVYPGYAAACNELIKDVMFHDEHAEWFVTGGDDVEPDQNHSADQIGAECTEHFDGTFGVMQPTGDRFAGGAIDRIAGSPWIGREFARRMYQGKGPYWHEYRHMFVDEELQAIAQKLGVFWQRPDLIHLHNHFQRESRALDSNAIAKPVPEFLKEANSPEHWNKHKAIFDARKAAGFPGSEPL